MTLEVCVLNENIYFEYYISAMFALVIFVLGHFSYTDEVKNFLQLWALLESSFGYEACEDVGIVLDKHFGGF